MKVEMATLYSRFDAFRHRLQWPNGNAHPEGIRRINHLFCDVLRHFRLPSVAKRRHSPTWGVVLVAGLLGGCAAPSGVGRLTADASAEAKQALVASRAKARWDALIKLDLDGAYAYLSPASKATMALDVYKAKHKVGLYRTVTVDGVKCEADACVVDLSLTYDYKRVKGLKTPLREQWIITQGQAWIVDRG